MGCCDFIKADLYRYCGNTRIKDFIKQYLTAEGFRFSVWLRICCFAKKKIYTKYTIFPVALVFFKHYKYKYGYDISYNADIGPGLLIFHISNIVLAPKKVGKNMTISQGCTVGMVIKDGIKEFPIIGDNVYMAPGSKIIGGITVGNNVAVGTNCVLNKSVADDAVVVGIPGRVISYKGAKEYVNNSI
ncbi:serine O-acetyltransferase [Clostridium manihotivorum]|uniref:Serine acetyltransferase n=1 Tax=Clostridium manihotivorum TaxID=2320868 RepID=A0A3R5UIM3_9CLOT|nr:serine acetyltransferase [Clostridium manihotivorum]QAA34734.1 serine acetyltransferase [Clostridium manihotivorum]